MTLSPDFGRLPGALETAIYRVVQEALHNVAKHANATAVNIEMSRDGDSVRLVIHDDGIGIAVRPNPGRQTFGLAGMHERISAIGGELKVTSSRRKGTRIEVNAPIGSAGLLHDSELGLNHGLSDALARGA